MSTRPYSKRFVQLVPDLADPNLYGAWLCKPRGGLMVDETPQGNGGTPGAASGVENTILGPMRRYMPNSGATPTSLGAANAFALTDVTLSFWIRGDNVAAAAYAVSYTLDANDQWVIGASSPTSISIYDDIDNANTFRYGTTIPANSLRHVVALMDALENRLYIDGVLVGSGESSSDYWNSYAGTLQHGGRRVGAAAYSGIVSPLLALNDAADQAWVTNEYLKGARACQFKTDWGVRQSLGNEAVAGMRVGVNSSPFEIINGSWQMSMDTINGHDVKVIECISAGRVAVPTSLFEATPTEAAFGTWGWWLYKGDTNTAPSVMFVASSTEAPSGAGQLGYYLRVGSNETPDLREMTGGATASLATGTAAGFPIATWTRCDITHRYDGQLTYYQDGVQDAQATDLTTTTSTYVVLELDPGDKLAYSDRQGDHCFQKLLGVVTP